MRMRLKEAEHFVAGGHLLAFQDPGACLGDDLLHKRQKRLNFSQQGLCLLLALLEQARPHLPDLPNHLLSHCNELLIEGSLLFCLLLLLLFSCLCSSHEPMELLSHLACTRTRERQTCEA